MTDGMSSGEAFKTVQSFLLFCQMFPLSLFHPLNADLFFLHKLQFGFLKITNALGIHLRFSYTITGNLNLKRNFHVTQNKGLEASTVT